MIKRLILAIILLIAVSGGLVGFNIFRDQMVEEYFASMPEQAVLVETVTAETATWKPEIRAVGTTNAARGVELSVEAAGIIREIGFESNEVVEEGQVLLQLDAEVQEADLEAARTRLELERTNLERQQNLQSRGVTTEANLQSAQAAYNDAEAQLARASAVLDQRRVEAPFSGVIGLPRVDLGAYISPGTVIATFQDISSMRVDFTLPERDLPALGIGQTLNVRLDDSQEVFTGQITGIDPRVDPSSRLVAVRGRIDNADGALTPGQFVRISIDLPEEDGVVAVPQTALTSSLYGDFVYVVRPREDAEDEFEARQVFVTPGRRVGAQVEIVEGVEAGDVVVSAGQNRLSNGSLVTRDEDEEDME